MKAIANTNKLGDQCRTALREFWNDSLEIESSRDGIVIALPLMLPDGIQVVIELRQVSSNAAVLSDRGEILSTLVGQGLNIEASKVQSILAERIATFDLERDGWELRKALRLPLNGLDIHLFGEALVSLAHLIYRHDPEPAEENVADRVVQKVFEEHHLQPKRNAILEGRLEKRIIVDYYLNRGPGLALEVVNRRNLLLPYMEQWGWRWTDLRRQHPRLIRAMVYDPEQQPWDSTALEIGRSVCEVFCPYFEREKLSHAFAALGR